MYVCIDGLTTIRLSRQKMSVRAMMIIYLYKTAPPPVAFHPAREMGRAFVGIVLFAASSVRLNGATRVKLSFFFVHVLEAGFGQLRARKK